MLSYSSQAQTLQGVVTNVNSGKPLWPVTVVNITTQQAAATDESGFYSIPANPGDKIAFSYIGYHTIEKVKPPSVIVATLNIVMEPTSYGLQEFQVRPGHLTQYQLDSAERVSIYKIQLERTHPSPFLSPASAIAEKFSKKAKETYKFQKVFAAGEIEKFIDTRYSPDLVNELTGITGDSIGHFMYAYPMPYDFARTASDLEIKMWIRSNYKEWIKKDTAQSAIKESETSLF